MSIRILASAAMSFVTVTSGRRAELLRVAAAVKVEADDKLQRLQQHDLSSSAWAVSAMSLRASSDIATTL